MKSRSDDQRIILPNSRIARIRPKLDDIDLRPVSIFDRAAIRRLVLDPEQEQFAGSVDAIFDGLQNSRHPDLEHPFAIVALGLRIGFFILREKEALPDWAPREVITMHSFRICRTHQGKGYGRAGSDLAIAWMRHNRTDVRQLMLAVNARNALARAVYLKSGFIDTGAIFRGPIGDQHLLSLDVQRQEDDQKFHGYGFSI
ncbi:GNAT family N-acetyltransferase [Mesorhizobium loti]|uniref:GNAT family N-acetyltransferase n=1 Tax=Rhizobium loti TaxID=381 RepID=UPI00041C354D|nr:GNAT family N-acetyltransferase [Mesorhizobium loti]